jgi:alcohol dehydrogenase class IV
MAHCVEAFTSRRAHPIIDDYALRGIELVGRYLGRAVRDGTDIEARAGLSLAAFYGGVCLGPVNTTAGHALAYPLGTRHRIAHGVANALIFPHVLAVNAPAVPEKTALVGRALGFGSEGRQAVLGGAHDFCTRLGLDMALRNHGVPRDDLPASAREAHAIRRLLDFNPVDLSEADILEIYEAAY